MDREKVLRDKQVVTIRGITVDVVAKAETFEIVSELTAAEANGTLRWIAGAKQELEERRKFFVKPLNDHVKEINALFKEVGDPLNIADRLMRTKVIEWRKQVEEVARKKQAELQRRAEQARARQEEKAAAKGEPPPPPAPVPTIEVPKTAGGVTTVKTWTFEITDITKVPRTYLDLNETLVRKHIRAGVREIPGLRIYQQDTVKVGA